VSDTPTYVVVTGLPGSGKSTVGLALPPGHHDGTRPIPPTLPPPFEPMLRPHPLVRVDTSGTLDEVGLALRVRAAIG
jgi:hypothetical protein